ncbi:hypothetical protein Nepgr_010501 [Nepenthes gracilis]|uniref:Uncharacterized protein n=1 Tax=Nepenthes gracilis TaxID=150966 RepID=A0AAD3SDB2_NEPGR|nr:hypothetical protein Nepgr_010501 [Nepenthes gracilis]
MLFLLSLSFVYPVPPDGLSLPTFPSSSSSSPLSTEVVQYHSSIHPSPSFCTSVSIPFSNSLQSNVSLGSSNEYVPSRLVGDLPPPPKSVILHMAMAFDVNPQRVSKVYTSQAVNLPYLDPIPISNGVADFANAALLGVTDSKPPLVSDASPPRASGSSAVQQNIVGEIKIEYQWKPHRGSHSNRKGHAEPQDKPMKVFKPTGRILPVSQPSPSKPKIKKKNHAPTASSKAALGPENIPISNAFAALQEFELKGPIVDSNEARNREMVEDELLQFKSPLRNIDYVMHGIEHMSFTRAWEW